MVTTESHIEKDLIQKLEELKYTYRSEIRDRAALETDFRQKFHQLTVNLEKLSAELKAKLAKITQTFIQTTKTLVYG